MRSRSSRSTQGQTMRWQPEETALPIQALPMALPQAPAVTRRAAAVEPQLPQLPQLPQRWLCTHGICAQQACLHTRLLTSQATALTGQSPPAPPRRRPAPQSQRTWQRALWRRAFGVRVGLLTGALCGSAVWQACCMQMCCSCARAVTAAHQHSAELCPCPSAGTPLAMLLGSTQCSTPGLEVAVGPPAKTRGQEPLAGSHGLPASSLRSCSVRKSRATLAGETAGSEPASRSAAQDLPGPSPCLARSCTHATLQPSSAASSMPRRAAWCACSTTCLPRDGHARLAQHLQNVRPSQLIRQREAEHVKLVQRAARLHAKQPLAVLGQQGLRCMGGDHSSHVRGRS